MNSHVHLGRAARVRMRARTEERRATEVVVATQALNRMLELRRPSYARIA
jgi:hypothetical protein